MAKDEDEVIEDEEGEEDDVGIFDEDLKDDSEDDSGDDLGEVLEDDLEEVLEEVGGRRF